MGSSSMWNFWRRANTPRKMRLHTKPMWPANPPSTRNRNFIKKMPLQRVPESWTRRQHEAVHREGTDGVVNVKFLNEGQGSAVDEAARKTAEAGRPKVDEAGQPNLDTATVRRGAHTADRLPWPRAPALQAQRTSSAKILLAADSASQSTCRHVVLVLWDSSKRCLWRAPVRPPGVQNKGLILR